jgi:predicted TIM-barrel fold metal-dependent hydrolase
MIINTHAHLGYDSVFDEEETEEGLIGGQKEFGIDITVVQPFIPRPYLSETRAYHNRIYELTQARKRRFFGMASVHPHFTDEDYYTETERCIKELRFVGLKLSPIAHACPPDGRDGRKCFEAAKALRVPIMVHTGAGIPFSDPARLINVVPDYREIPVIVAHCGGDMFFTQALWLAKTYDNVFLEPSWLSVLNLKAAVSVVGPAKIMFSSDHTVNIPVELAKYVAAASGADLEQMLFKTALTVFGKERLLCG